jgi:hypothetical protein
MVHPIKGNGHLGSPEIRELLSSFGSPLVWAFSLLSMLVHFQIMCYAKGQERSIAQHSEEKEGIHQTDCFFLKSTIYNEEPSCFVESVPNNELFR